MDLGSGVHEPASREGLLLRFDFASGAGRYWLGVGTLDTIGGEQWIGTGKVASIGDVVSSINGTAPEQTFTLSGVDPEFIAKAQASKAEYYGRLCFVFLQQFDAAWQVVGAPKPLWWGRMSVISFAQQASEQGFTRSVTLSAESVFSGRRRPRNGFLTDRDQQARYAGDRGCERTLGMQAKTIVFPDN